MYVGIVVDRKITKALDLDNKTAVEKKLNSDSDLYSTRIYFIDNKVIKCFFV